MYDELIKRLRETPSIPVDAKLHNEAADAIEELGKITTHYEEESKGWWLAACDAKEERERLKEQLDNAEIENIKLREEFARYRGKHRWIPVKERLPEDRNMVLATVDGVVCVAFYGNYMWEEAETYSILYPTHWMPIPQPPEDGES